jgi:hypothetical protein
MPLEATKNISAKTINIIDLYAPKEGTGDSPKKNRKLMEKQIFFCNVCPHLTHVCNRVKERPFLGPKSKRGGTS